MQKVEDGHSTMFHLVVQWHNISSPQLQYSDYSLSFFFQYYCQQSLEIPSADTAFSDGFYPKFLQQLSAKLNHLLFRCNLRFDVTI